MHVVGSDIDGQSLVKEFFYLNAAGRTEGRTIAQNREKLTIEVQARI